MTKATRKGTAPERAQCPDCGKWISRRQDMPRHRRTHIKGAKRYRCFFPNCSFGAIQRQGFTAHVIKHTGERPYRCAFCDFNAQDPSLVTKHHSTRHNYSRGVPESQVRQITRPVVDWDALRTNAWNSFKIPLLDAWFDSVDDRPRRNSGAPSTSDSASPSNIPSDEDSPIDAEDEMDDCESTTEDIDCEDEHMVELPVSTSTTESSPLEAESSFVEAFIPEIRDDAEIVPRTPIAATSTSVRAMPHASSDNSTQMATGNPTLHPALAYFASSGSSHSRSLVSDFGPVARCLPNAPETSAYNLAWETHSTHNISPSSFDAAQDASLFSWVYDGQNIPSITPNVKSQCNGLLDSSNFDFNSDLVNAFDFTSDSPWGLENSLNHAKSRTSSDDHYTHTSAPDIEMLCGLPDDHSDPTSFVGNDSNKLLFNFFRELCGGGLNV